MSIAREGRRADPGPRAAVQVRHGAPQSYGPAEFSLADARSLVSDLFEAKAWIYWTDLLATWAVAMTTYAAVIRLPGRPLAATACFLVSCLAIYRLSVFNHELVHFRKGTFRRFRAAWNLLVGIPFLMPSFTYFTHLAHHARRHYGTANDGEYLALGTSPPSRVLLFLGASFVFPLVAVVRFGLLGPLSWVHPRLRTWVQARCSSMVIDPRYVRPLPSSAEYRTWLVQEIACFAVVWSVPWFIFRGRIPWYFVGQAYITSVVVLTLNAVRTLGAHRYLHRGEELTFTDQLLDSLNFPRWPLTSGLWAPVGLRFHALHHLFPSMPYHNLAEAHRRLMAALPSDSIYRQTESPGLCAAVADLWRRASQAGAARRYAAPHADEASRGPHYLRRRGPRSASPGAIET